MASSGAGTTKGSSITRFRNEATIDNTPRDLIDKPPNKIISKYASNVELKNG